MKDIQDSRNKQNYKNFGYTLVGLLAIIFFVGLIGFIGYQDGIQDSSGLSPYEAGRVFGRSLRQFFDYFVLSGTAYGCIFALIASLEKKNSLPMVILHGLLSWGYVVYYVLKRRTVHTN